MGGVTNRVYCKMTAFLFCNQYLGNVAIGLLCLSALPRPNTVLIELQTYQLGIWRNGQTNRSRDPESYQLPPVSTTCSHIINRTSPLLTQHMSPLNLSRWSHGALGCEHVRA